MILRYLQRFSLSGDVLSIVVSDLLGYFCISFIFIKLLGNELSDLVQSCALVVVVSIDDGLSHLSSLQEVLVGNLGRMLKATPRPDGELQHWSVVVT